jgi:hypothetical protein
MLFFGLPLICVLTFQLVKDMAVYEMGAAMKPASELLEKAAAEETKIAQLNGQLAAIEGKKTDRESKLAEFAAKKAKAKAELEEELKRTDEARKDAISLTEYQTKELSTVEARQAAITRQFDIDAAQISKAIADLRVRREAKLVMRQQVECGGGAHRERLQNETCGLHEQEERLRKGQGRVRERQHHQAPVDEASRLIPGCRRSAR